MGLNGNETLCDDGGLDFSEGDGSSRKVFDGDDGGQDFNEGDVVVEVEKKLTAA